MEILTSLICDPSADNRRFLLERNSSLTGLLSAIIFEKASKGSGSVGRSSRFDCCLRNNSFS